VNGDESWVLLYCQELSREENFAVSRFFKLLCDFYFTIVKIPQMYFNNFMKYLIKKNTECQNIFKHITLNIEFNL